MTNFSIDNSVDADLDAIVTWQYDLSPRICALIDQFKQWFNDTTGSVWESLAKKFNVESDDCDDFALAILGRLIGVPRFNVVIDDETWSVSTELYRRIVVARFRLLQSAATIPDYVKFCDYIFGEGVVVPSDGHDMSLSFTWEGDEPSTEDELELKYIYDEYMELIVEYPTGVHDNIPSDCAMFWMGENAGNKPTNVPSQHFFCGGFDNSSFTWKR